MKLGIACVYYYEEAEQSLLNLQLSSILRTTTQVQYRVYAAANRLQEPLREQLGAIEQVEIVDLPNFSGSGSAEHAYYLDRLLRHAIEQGCTHVCTLDADSFPMTVGWPEKLCSKLEAEHTRVAAVFREENGDTFLPHPCGFFSTAEFICEVQPQWLPDTAVLQSSEYQAFLKATRQRVDTGIGYGYALWKRNENWTRLHRSNRKNHHFLMAGIYGGLFFHLGATSRRPLFAVEQQHSAIIRLAYTIRSLPMLWRLADSLENVQVKRNRRILQLAKDQLLTDPESFLSSL